MKCNVRTSPYLNWTAPSLAGMVNNELVLLDSVLAQRQSDRPIAIRDDEAFELFACEQALIDRDVSSDEVAEGVFGGGDDGGIDGAYVFLDDVLLNEESAVFQDDFAPTKVPVGTLLELWLVQAKRRQSFTETAIDKAASSTKRLLSLSEEDDNLRQLYSPGLVTRTGYLRDALRTLAARHPKLEIHFVYATRGTSGEMNAKVEIKARDLETQFTTVMPGATGHVEFLGAAELWRRTNAVPSYTTQLSFQEHATSGTSHVALVKLRDYVGFLTDENDGLRRHIFDWNVRDYQGNVEVNREIRESLLDSDAPEFWWLNNGVTVVCSKASVMGKTYSLDDVQVVNGLQTSHTIHSVLREADADDPVLDRAVLVRILVTGDDLATRDQVIRATNRQTAVPAASLRATDDIQRDIEKYFFTKGWFYDRRKNFYRNSGKSPERIVSIPLLAQAVVAMGLSRPDDSRARPSSLLKRDEDYERIFSASIPLDVYLWLAESQKAIDAFLLSEASGATSQDRTNLRFHLAMIAASKLAGSKIWAPGQLSTVVASHQNIVDADLEECWLDLRARFASFVETTADPVDKVAKGSAFVKYLLDEENN